MDIREIEKGIELFYAFLRKNPTLCPHSYVEFSRHFIPLVDYECKYSLTRVLRNCEHCDSTQVEYILIDAETGERLDTDSLSLSTLADFFNSLDDHVDKNFDSHYSYAVRTQVDTLIAEYEKAKNEEEEEERELYKKAYEKIGPLFVQFN